MHKLYVSIILLIYGAALAACGGSQDQQGDPFSIRQARPTFTPTALPPPTPPVANPPPLAEGSNAASGEPAVAFAPGLPAKLVITAQLVNARTAPNLNSDILGEIGRGQEFDIVAQNEAGDWWQACCYDETLFWIFGELVETIGEAADAVAAQPVPAQPTAVPVAPTATPVPPAATTVVVVAATNTPALPEPTPTWTPVPTSATAIGEPDTTDAPASDASGFAFDMRLQEQFPENNVVRVFLYVYNEEVQALEGYSLHVTKDGVELPVTEKSFGPQAGFTWPIAEDRQRFQNMKAEFPGLPAGGIWVIQLVDSEGKLAGPPATFELTNNSQEQELYIRYEQR